jgi:hypothetical protein
MSKLSEWRQQQQAAEGSKPKPCIIDGGLVAACVRDDGLIRFTDRPLSEDRANEVRRWLVEVCGATEPIRSGRECPRCGNVHDTLYFCAPRGAPPPADLVSREAVREWTRGYHGNGMGPFADGYKAALDDLVNALPYLGRTPEGPK